MFEEWSFGGELTILVANKRVAKTYQGDKSTPYPDIYKWTVRERGVENLDQLAEEIERCAAYGKACIVRGVPIDDYRGSTVRRLVHPCTRTGDPPTFQSAPGGLHWICIDVDGLPTDFDARTHPDEYADDARQALPTELANGRCFYQLSASAGIKPGARVHLWFWLEHRALDDALRDWANGIEHVDASLFGAVQPHYVVPPTFIDSDDPIPRRTGWLDGTAEVWPAGLMGVDEWKVHQKEQRSRKARPQTRKQLDDARAQGAVRAAVYEITTAGEGDRNATVCRKANSLGRLVRSEVITMEDARFELLRAAELAYGPEWRHRGSTVTSSIDRCLDSGFAAGEPPRPAPVALTQSPRHAVVAEVSRVLARGDHLDIATTLIGEDASADGGTRPSTDELGRYHRYSPQRGMWQHERDNGTLRRIDSFAGCDVLTKESSRPLKMKASDAPAVLDVMRRHTLRPGFFRDDLIAFDNSTAVHVAFGELVAEPLRADHGARIMLPVAYDPEWQMPESGLLAHYLRTTFDHEGDRLVVVELFGAALMGLGTRYKKAWFLTDGPEVEGQGGTGKSQLLKMLEGLVPDERQCSIPPQLFADDYHGADLYGKTLNLVYEAPDTDILREEGIKAIVHGEQVRRRRIRESPIEFTPHALHVFAVNRLPDAPGASGAFWDRWRVLEFSKRFRETDDAVEAIGQKIVDTEFADLVHLALRGAARLLERGKYTSSDAQQRALDKWRLSADPVASFIFDMTEPAESTSTATWISGARLYDAYRDWCGSRGHKPCSMQKFGRRLPPSVEKSRSGGRSRYKLELVSGNRD